MIANVLPAVAVGAALLVCWLWRPRAAAEPGVRLLVICYAVLGAWALWFGVYAAPGQEPAALQLWKPTVMYAVLATVLIAAPLLGWGYPVKAVFGTYFIFSGREWRWINLCFAALCALLGGVNLVIVYFHSKNDWEGFKWSCMVNVIAVVLLRVTFIWVDTLARIVTHVQGRGKAPQP
jgi:intracellular septation protein A